MMLESLNPQPPSMSAATSKLSEFENKMQLSINPPCMTEQTPKPECLFSDLFATVVMENTSTFSPIGARGATAAAAPQLSIGQHHQQEARGKADSDSHMADTSNKTDGVVGASDGATDAMTVATRNGGDSRIHHRQPQPNGSRVAASAEDDDGGRDKGGGESDGAKQRRKRTRSKEQLDQNRIAQQKYRDRKRNEASDLQSALDQMANQLGAYKVLEGRMREMDATNQGLQQVVIQQMQRIRQLEGQVEHQGSVMSNQLSDLKEAVSIATRQDGMINELQGKLHVQEQGLMQMRERLQSAQSSATSCGAPSLLADCGGGAGGSPSMRLLGLVKNAVHNLIGTPAAAQAAGRMTPDDLVVAISQQILSACQ